MTLDRVRYGKSKLWDGTDKFSGPHKALNHIKWTRKIDDQDSMPPLRNTAARAKGPNKPVVRESLRAY